MRYLSNLMNKVTDAFYKYLLGAKLLALTLLLLGLLSCWSFGSQHDSTKVLTNAPPQTGEELDRSFPYLAVREGEADEDPASAERIELSSFQNGCRITRGGSYRLSGELNGGLHIDAGEEAVHLFLDNVSISSASGPAIYCKNAENLVITLLPDTENSLADSVHYQDYPDAEACLYSVCDMTVNGSGALSVTGLYADAIRSKDVLKILGGNFSVKCKRAGFRGNDGLYISGGNFDVSTEKIAFRTENRGGDGRGNLVVAGGSFMIVAGRYAFVSSAADLYISNCSIRHRSVLDLYDCGGRAVISQECVQ